MEVGDKIMPNQRAAEGCLCRYQVFQMFRHYLDLHITVITVPVQEKKQDDSKKDIQDNG